MGSFFRSHRYMRSTSVTIVIVFLVAFRGSLNAQSRSFEPYISPSFEYSMGSFEQELVQQFSINFEALVHRNIGLNWHFDWVKGSNDYREVHIPGGSSIVSLIGSEGLSNASGETLVSLFILLIFPEGVSGHFRFGDAFDVSPYFNFLSMDYYREWNWPKYKNALHSSAGLKTTFLKGKYVNVGVFGEWRKSNRRSSSYRVGLSLSYNPAP